MRKIITCSLIAFGIAIVTPAMAQSVYIGPGGVGVGVGVPHGPDYYRDHNRRYGDRDGYYEGRSAYPNNGYGHRRYQDDN